MCNNINDLIDLHF